MLIKILDNLNRLLNKLLIFISGCFLIGMIVLTCANIVMRAVWLPINGTFELMGFFGAVITAFTLGYTHMKRGHISVDVLINMFSARMKKAVGIVNSAICIVFFGIAGWQIFIKAETIRLTGEVTETLRIIYYPFVYAVALGCLALALVYLTELIKSSFLGNGGEN